ncbi:unnamed protein product [Sphagnum balticum]
MEPHKVVMEMMDVGRQHASTAFSSMAKVLVKAAGPPTNTNRFFFHKSSQHLPTQPDRGGSIQLVNPLERISLISQSLLQKAVALSQDESVRNSKTAGLLLASTSSSALATLPSATLKTSAFPHPTETGSQEQQVASLLKPVKARPTWVKDPSKKALALADKIAQEAKVGVAGFIRPVDQTWTISSSFGPRWGRNHNGVDLAAPTGEPVLAADAGEVTFAGWEPSGYGYLVEITHKDGWKTLYAHTSEIFTWEGQFVRRGECIASVGETGRATGPHLHWEIRNQNGSPVDPATYVDL